MHCCWWRVKSRSIWVILIIDQLVLEIRFWMHIKDLICKSYSFFFFFFWLCQIFPGGASGQEPACHCRRHKRHGFDPWVGKIPCRRKWQPKGHLLELPCISSKWGVCTTFVNTIFGVFLEQSQKWQCLLTYCLWTAHIWVTWAVFRWRNSQARTPWSVCILEFPLCQSFPACLSTPADFSPVFIEIQLTYSTM